MKITRSAPSCNTALLKNEKSVLSLKQSKLRKNRNQAKNDAVSNQVAYLIDSNIKKVKRRATADKRRALSK